MAILKLAQAEAEKLLLQKENIENFLNENSEKIFSRKKTVKVLEIKRAKTLNPTSFNVLYRLEIDGEYLEIRASTSTTYNNDYNYFTMVYLREHGFNEGDITIAEPLTFFDEYNLLLYKNVPGDVFIADLDVPTEEIKPKLVFASRALEKLHRFDQIPFKLWDHTWEYNIERIKKYFPEITTVLEVLYDKLIEKVNSSKKILCHGDFQPNNLIFNHNHLYLIDWGSTTFAAKEMDIACFATQLANMLYKTKNQDKYQDLKNTFIDAYKDFDRDVFNSFTVLYSLQMLDSTLEFTDFESNKDRIYFVYNLVKKNLENFDIKLKDSNE